jgi:hypothetical protein
MKHVIVLIDNSFSMKLHSSDIIKGLNTFIVRLQSMRDTRDIFLTVMFFSDKTYYLLKLENIHKVQPFSIDSIPHYGLTFLYDAIEEILDDFIQLSFNIEQHFFIITDGCDTGSVKSSECVIKDRCENAIKNGWIITHCGVDSGNLGSSVLDVIANGVDDLGNLLGGLTI